MKQEIQVYIWYVDLVETVVCCIHNYFPSPRRDNAWVNSHGPFGADSQRRIDPLSSPDPQIPRSTSKNNGWDKLGLYTGDICFRCRFFCDLLRENGEFELHRSEKTFAYDFPNVYVLMVRDSNLQYPNEITFPLQGNKYLILCIVNAIRSSEFFALISVPKR